MYNNHKTVEDKMKKLPSYRLSASKKDQMHQNVMNALKDEDHSQPIRRKFDMRKIIVAISTAAALALCSIIGVNIISTNDQSTGNVEQPESIQNPSPTEQPEETEKDPREEQIIIEQKAKEIVQVLHNRQMDTLASYVHKEKGLLFAPEAYIESYSLIFTKEQIATLLDDKTEYVWGLQEANTEIKLTPEAYFEKRIQAERFLNPDEVNVNPNVPEGERSTNIKNYFPEAMVVEFHYAGTEQFDRMDWRSLHLVFEENELGDWDLVAIVNGLWVP